MAQKILPWHRDAQHLSLDRTSREALRPDLSGPSSGAVNHESRRKRGFHGTHAERLPFVDFDLEYFVSRGKIDATVFCRRNRGRCQPARIDAALLQEEGSSITA